MTGLMDALRRGGPVADATVAPPPIRRDRLWELSPTLHCSIIGPCLTTADLRSLMGKLGLGRSASEHDLHAQAVARAARKDEGGKLLHKLLDRRHESDIQRFAKAEAADEVRRLWRAAVDEGRIPGAYWAVMTHPQSDRGVVKDVFGEVHMLSHLVGRSVRSDLRRLAELEEETRAQAETIASFEERVAGLTTTRSEAERREAGQMRATREFRLVVRDTESSLADEAIARLREQLAQAQAKAAVEEERRIEAEGVARRLSEEIGRGAGREAALQLELDNLERSLTPQQEDGETPSRVGSLAGLTILYVGGRPRQVAQARLAIRNRGAELLTHDGGIGNAPTLLPGLVSRADVVLFPVDCISHAAAGTLKRCCRDLGRDFLPLRSASLASLLVALGALRPSAEG